jgi:hypothetical protein
VDYFYSAAKPRSRDTLWPIFAPTLIPVDFSAEDQAKYYAFWKTGHDRLAKLSSCGRNLVVSNSSHFIQYDQPQTVTAYILAVVELSKASTRKSCAAGS